MAEGSPGDHPFRGDIGAALERIRKLEEENAELREELARERDRTQPAIRLRGPWSSPAMSLFTLAAVTGALAAITTALVFASRPPPPPPPSVLLLDPAPSVATPPSVDLPTPAPPVMSPEEPASAPDPDKHDCTPPYVIDPAGVKRYDPRCL